LHIKEAYKLHRIEKMAKLSFERYFIPKAEEVYESRILNFVEQLSQENVQDDKKIKIKNEWVWPLMQMSKEQLVEIILKSEIKKFSDGYLNMPDVNVEEKWKLSSAVESRGDDRNSRGSRSSRTSRGSDNKTALRNIRLFINLGRKDDLKYDEMRDVIFKNTKVSGRAIRDIEMKNTFSFFMTDPESAAKLCSVKNMKLKGREITIKKAEDVKQGK
jgi:hypothetical protein